MPANSRWDLIQGLKGYYYKELKIVMGANKVIFRTEHRENWILGALHSSIILRGVGWQVDGWLVGRSSNKYQLAPRNISKRGEHLPSTTAKTDGQKDRHDEGGVAFWNFVNASKKRSKIRFVQEREGRV